MSECVGERERGGRRRRKRRIGKGKGGGRGKLEMAGVAVGCDCAFVFAKENAHQKAQADTPASKRSSKASNVGVRRPFRMHA